VHCRSFTDAIQQYLATNAHPPRPSPMRILLSALQLAQKSLDLPFAIPHSCWLAISGLQALAPPPRRSWFPIHWLDCSPASEWAEFKPAYGFPARWVYLLRISEVRRLQPADFTATQLHFRPSKSSLQGVWRSAASFVQLWLTFLSQYLLSQPFPEARALSLLRRCAHPSNSTITWHSLRRGAAVTLQHLGLPLPNLCAWGRWQSDRTVRLYVEPDVPVEIHVDLLLLRPGGQSVPMHITDLFPTDLGIPRSSSAPCPAREVAPTLPSPASLMQPCPSPVPDPPSSPSSPSEGPPMPAAASHRPSGHHRPPARHRLRASASEPTPNPGEPDSGAGPVRKRQRAPRVME
jgi:hypothetical protein